MAKPPSKPIVKDYKKGLVGQDLARYQCKIVLCHNIDPYDLCEGDYCRQISLLPSITYVDIVNYLVLSTNSVSKEEMKAYKSLEAHNFFTSGWVDPVINVKSLSTEKMIRLGKVNHSQSLRVPPLLPWILAVINGEIITAHCTCMAGKGEACSHVGALLFAVETAVRLRDSTSSTSELCKWLPAHVKNVPYLPIAEVDFTSSKKKKAKLDKCNTSRFTKEQLVVCSLNTPKRNIIPDDKEMKIFHSQLAECGPSAILRVVPEFCEMYAPKIKKEVPAPLSSLFCEANVDLEFKDILALCEVKFNELKVSVAEAEKTEFETKTQTESKNWFKQRAGRITASNMRSVCKTDIANPSVSLIKTLCYPHEFRFSTSATRWGCAHEKEARDKYEQHLATTHDGVTVSDAGLHIHPDYPHIGATPDGIVIFNCCGKGVWEVKCPYCLRYGQIDDITANPKCCLESVDGKFLLKKTHQYYYQVQTQINVCQVDFCNFVVSTENGFYVERIVPDLAFWEEVAGEATLFFKVAILPEQASKWYTRACSRPLNGVPYHSENEFCICKGDETDMYALIQHV